MSAADSKTPISPQAILAAIKLNLLRRPLLHPETCEDCLDISRRELMAMIETGALAWAWNIGLGTSRKEIRVLAHCVCEKQLGPLAGIGATKDLKLPDVVDLLLPRTRPQLRGRELQRIFRCPADQVRYLGEAGELVKVNEELPKGGPYSSPHFTRASVVEFLEKRRLT